MKIEYFGHSCFRIRSEKGTSIVTDPYTRVGYELPEGLAADIILVSHNHFDHNFMQGVRGERVIIEDEKKYEYDDIVVDGFSCNHDEKGGALRGKNVVHTMYVDGWRLCHLGDIGEPCTDRILSKIGKVDVLLIPIGGTYTIDSAQAKEYVEKLQPKIVIPMHYKPSDGTLDIADEKPFLRQFENVCYAPKNKATDLKEYLSDRMQILFMEKKEDA